VTDSLKANNLVLNMAQPRAELEKTAIAQMLIEEFGIRARPFQLQLIQEMVLRDAHTLMVQKTGNGKSTVPLGSLLVKGGIGVTIVPLLAIGTGQAAAAVAACTSFEARCWDDLGEVQRRLLLERLEAVKDRDSL